MDNNKHNVKCESRLSIFSLIARTVLYLVIFMPDFFWRSSNLLINCVHLVANLTWMFIFVFLVVKAYNTKLFITDKKVIGKGGRYFKIKDTMEVTFDEVNDVMVHQSLLGRIFGYGMLVVSTSLGVFYYRGISSPYDLKDALMNQIDKINEANLERNAQKSKF